MKVGVLTYHTSYNYGAFLQAFALCARINKIDGVSAEIIDFTMKRAYKMNLSNALADKRNLTKLLFNLKRYCVFKKSIKKFMPLSIECIVSDDMSDFERVADYYDIIVAGSDEIWKVDGYRGFPTVYWLPKEHASYRKCSYAVSSRTSLKNISEKKIKQICQYINDFEYVGVRDQSTYNMIYGASSGKIKIHKNCDPTFLYDFKPNVEKGKRILSKKFFCDPKRKTIALMSESDLVSKWFIEKYKGVYNIVSLYQPYAETKCDYIPDPFEWIDVVSACDGMVTTYFHGTVFAIKCGTPFVSIETRKLYHVEDSKIYDLLSRNGLQNRFGLQCAIDFNMEKLISPFIDSIEEKSVGDDFKAVCIHEEERGNSFIEYMEHMQRELNNETY